jgi:hypothetical protein
MFYTFMFFLVKVLPALMALAYAARLVYINAHPKKREALLAKYKKGTPAYDMYKRVYSNKFLKGVSYIAIYFTGDLVFTIYKFYHEPPVLLNLLVLASLVLLIIGLAKIHSALKSGEA